MSNGVSGIVGGVGVMDGVYDELRVVNSGVAEDDMESCGEAHVDRDDDDVGGRPRCDGEIPPLLYKPRFGMLMALEEASRSREDVDASRGSGAYNTSSSPLPSASSASPRPVGPTMARMMSTRCCMMRPSWEPWVFPWAAAAPGRKQKSRASSNKMSWAAVGADCDDCARPSIPRMCLASTKTAAVGNTFASRWSGSGAETGAWPRLELESGGVRGPVRCGASVAEEEVAEEGDDADGDEVVEDECVPTPPGNVNTVLLSRRSSRSARAWFRWWLQEVATRRQLRRASCSTCAEAVRAASPVLLSLSRTRMRVPRKARWSEISSTVVGRVDEGTLCVCVHVSSFCCSLASAIRRSDVDISGASAELSRRWSSSCTLANSQWGVCCVWSWFDGIPPCA